MLSITTNEKELARKLQAVQKQMPFALSLAANRTAQAVKAGLRDEMARVFDRPRPYTLNSLQMQSATKQAPTAIIGFKLDKKGKSVVDKYLAPQVFGGQRNMKGSEKRLGQYWVPGYDKGNIQDQYGNVKRELITEILDSTGNLAASKSLRRKKSWQKYSYFVELKDGKPVGILMRAGKNNVRVALQFIKSPTYKRRFDFFGVGERVARRVGPEILGNAIRQAIETAR